MSNCQFVLTSRRSYKFTIYVGQEVSRPLKSKLQVLFMLSMLPNDMRLGGFASVDSHSCCARRCVRLCSACFHSRHEMSWTQSRRTCNAELRRVNVEPGSRLRNHNSNASPASPTLSVKPTSDVYNNTVIKIILHKSSGECCLFIPHVLSRPLQSSHALRLAIPRTRTVFASRAFSVAAPTIWNCRKMSSSRTP